MSRTPASAGTRACAVLAVLVLGCCAASSNLRSRTTAKPADAHTQIWRDTYRVAPDGKVSHRRHNRTTIHTEFAIDELGDPRVVHDAASEKLEVLRDVTTMRDGTEVAIKPNSVNETTPSRLAAAPAYADVRETVVTHVGLEVGCTNDFEYEISSTAAQETFALVAPLHLPHTVAERVVVVEVPEDREVHWQCLGCKVKPVVKTKAGVETLTFTWTQLPALNTAEAHADGPAPGQPRLVLGTAESWGLLSDALLESFLVAAKPDDVVHEQALALVENLATTDQRIAALWRFVVEQIRTVHWPLSELGFRPSPAAAVLDRSYGHSLDKAVLLTALLRSLDISARPVLLSRDNLFARDVPILDQFSEVWVIVDTGSERWLSTTALLPGDGTAYLSGRSSLDLEVGTALEIVPPTEATVANHARLVADIEVAADGKVTAEMQITRTGTYSPYFEAIEKGSASVATDQVPSGWSTNCDGCYARAHHLAPDLSTFAIRAEATAPGAGRVLEVDLPWVPDSQLEGADIHRLTRATSMELRSLGMESVHFEIRAADALEARSELPMAFLQNSVGSVISNHESRDGALVVDATVTLEKRVLAPDDYLSLRDLVTELHRAGGRSLLYVRKP